LKNQTTKLYGLIGYPLSHSFSKGYFTKKFEKAGITDCFYDNFPLENIDLLPQLIATNPNLAGLNVTIPYKQQVIPFLDELHESAAAVGAVNTIKFQDGKLIGFNTDVYGFEQSLLPIINKKYDQKYDKKTPLKSLVLGTGGAAKAIFYILKKNNLNPTYVSRTKKQNQLIYSHLDKAIIDENQIIINTTPLGMSPKIDTCPDLPYELLTENHILYDLVYNPEVTLFLEKGLQQGATVKNGLEMLHLQAEKAWEIWQA
jgi:shikimate dehydrogenase